MRLRRGAHEAPRLNPRQVVKRRRFLTFVEVHSRRLVILLLVVGLIQAFYLNWAILHERDARREQINEAICSLVRAVPPHINVRIDKVRADFHCGPYTPPPLAPTPSRSSGSPSNIPRTRTVTQRASPTPSVRTVVGPTTIETRVKVSTQVRISRPPPRTVTHTVTSSPGFPCRMLPPLCKG